MLILSPRRRYSLQLFLQDSFFQWILFTFWAVWMLLQSVLRLHIEKFFQVWDHWDPCKFYYLNPFACLHFTKFLFVADVNITYLKCTSKSQQSWLCASSILYSTLPSLHFDVDRNHCKQCPFGVYGSGLFPFPILLLYYHKCNLPKTEVSSHLSLLKILQWLVWISQNSLQWNISLH